MKRIDVSVSEAESYRHPQRLVDRAVRRASVQHGERVHVTLRGSVEVCEGRGVAFVPYFEETVYAR